MQCIGTTFGCYSPFCCWFWQRMGANHNGALDNPFCFKKSPIHWTNIQRLSGGAIPFGLPTESWSKFWTTRQTTTEHCFRQPQLRCNNHPHLLAFTMEMYQATSRQIAPFGGSVWLLPTMDPPFKATKNKAPTFQPSNWRSNLHYSRNLVGAMICLLSEERMRECTRHRKCVGCVWKRLRPPSLRIRCMEVYYQQMRQPQIGNV